MQDQKTPDIDIELIINHWIATSKDDFKTMDGLFNYKSYNWALFLGHIALEKMLKALFVRKQRKHAPAIHNLYRLAEMCQLELTEDYADWLDTITSFNLNARYNDYKREFYRLCTREYTES